MGHKKIISWLVCGALALFPLKGYSETDELPSYSEIEASAGATDHGIGISMIGWGLALVIGIVILAVTLGSNDNSNAHN